MDKAEKIIRGSFLMANTTGVSRGELIKAMEWEIISHSVGEGKPSGYMTARSTMVLREVYPGLTLWAILGGNTRLDFTARVKNKKVIEEVNVLLKEYNRSFSEGCIYCGSAQCVAYTHGESICG